MDHNSFIDKVSSNAPLSRQECSEFLEAFIGILEESLATGQTVMIPSFGNFEPRKRNERIMTNPSTPGKKMLVPPKVVASFKPSNILKNKVNE